MSFSLATSARGPLESALHSQLILMAFSHSLKQFAIMLLLRSNIVMSSPGAKDAMAWFVASWGTRDIGSSQVLASPSQSLLLKGGKQKYIRYYTMILHT